MCMQCCKEFGKWIVFSLFLVDMFVGLCLLGLLLAYLLKSGDNDEGFSISFYVFIAVCCLLIIAGIMGCVAAVQETRWLMFLAVAFIIVIAVFVLLNFIYLVYMVSAVDSGTLEHKTIRAFNKVGKGDAVADAEFDSLQSTLYCCGVYSAADYGTKGIRKSCYAVDENKPFVTGCYNAQKEMVESYGVICAVLTGLLFILLVITIIWSYCYIGCYC